MQRTLTCLTAFVGTLAADPAPAPYSIAAEHHLDADLDDGGSVSRSSARLRAGLPLWQNEDSFLALSAGYQFDHYNFSGFTADPWENIHQARLALPFKADLRNNWSFFVAPWLRTSWEDGGDLSESVTFGGLGAAWYRFSKNFALGAGAGVSQQIDDDIAAYPLLLLEWQFAENFTLTTLPTPGFRIGPSLTLQWQATPDWQLALSAQYEGDRFRLDEDSAFAPDGVGETQQARIALAASWSATENLLLTFHAGLAFANEIEVEDAGGNTIFEDDRDPTPVFGFDASLKF